MSHPPPAPHTTPWPRRPRACAMLILLVDDEEPSARMLTELLRGEGFVVETCASGHSAAKRLSRDPVPDVLITDINMPGIDGVEVARIARGRRPSLPILVVTAYPQLARRLEHSVDPPPTIFIKPLDYGALTAALTALEDRLLAVRAAR